VSQKEREMKLHQPSKKLSEKKSKNKKKIKQRESYNNNIEDAVVQRNKSEAGKNEKNEKRESRKLEKSLYLPCKLV
jgi:hypothetical protein